MIQGHDLVRHVSIRPIGVVMHRWGFLLAEVAGLEPAT